MQRTLRPWCIFFAVCVLGVLSQGIAYPQAAPRSEDAENGRLCRVAAQRKIKQGNDRNGEGGEKLLAEVLDRRETNLTGFEPTVTRGYASHRETSTHRVASPLFTLAHLALSASLRLGAE